MLRITVKNIPRNKTVLVLEGKICQEWVRELQLEIEKGIKKGRKISLDFSRVSFIDEDGARMINQLSPQKIGKINCSLFIRTMLRMRDEEER